MAMESTELKVSELLKEVNVDYSPQFTKLVDDTVSAIKASIDKIPNDFKVIILFVFLSAMIFGAFNTELLNARELAGNCRFSIAVCFGHWRR